MKAILHVLRSRIAGLFRRRRLEGEMAEEMQAHLEVLTEEGMAAGMSPAEARLAAQKRFGGVAQIEERCRDEQRFVWLEQVGKDVGFAARSLARARGFSLTVIGMLVLGIGIANVVFILTSWILLFAQPYPHVEQLFLLGFKDKQGGLNPYRLRIHWDAYQERKDLFSSLAAVTRDVSNIVIDGQPTSAVVMNASPDCFHILGIAPVVGRAFLPDEYRSGADNVVVLTDLFWRKHFGAAADVLGRKLLVDQQVCTVVGVLKPNQSFPAVFQGELYRPLMVRNDPTNPFSQIFFMVGRLMPDCSPEQATAALAAMKPPDLPAWAAPIVADQQPRLITLTELNRPEAFWVLFVAGGLLYAIACLNAANLMLVRLLSRRREMGIRLALGGARWRVARLVAMESMGLVLTATLVVLLAARWLFPALLMLVTGNEDVRYNSYFYAGNIGCIAGLSLLAAGVISLVPVWRVTKVEVNVNLKEGGTATGESRPLSRLRASLVVVQAALAVILLAGTGLMFRSFERLHRVDLGFNPIGIEKVQILFPRGYELVPEARLQLFERLQQRLAALPGVKAVSFGQDSLFRGGFGRNAELRMADGSFQPVAGNFVAANFQTAAGLTVKQGRWLSGERGRFEVVINETMARNLFGDEIAVGRSFKIKASGDFPLPVVGVVKDVRENVRSSAEMNYYLPIWTYPLNCSTLLLRLEQTPPAEFAGSVRRVIYETDARLIVSRVNSVDELIAQSMTMERFAFRMLRSLTAIGLLLAVVGLFSVIAYTVDSRMKEFGVRLALGARPANLHRLVMRRGLVTAGLGVVVGVAGALALTRFMQSLLFETTPYDPLVYAAVAAACWLPARRAARVDITKLLRTE